MAKLDPAVLRQSTIAVSFPGGGVLSRVLGFLIAVYQRNLARNEDGKLLAKYRGASHVMWKRRGEGLNDWFSMEERGGVERPLKPKKGQRIVYLEIADEIRTLLTPEAWRGGEEEADWMIGQAYDVLELPQFLLNRFAEVTGIRLRIDAEKGTVCSTAVAHIIERMTDAAQAPSVWGTLILKDITPAHFCNRQETLKIIGDCTY